MNLGPDAYRYDPYLNAYAINCGVEGRINEGAVEFLRSVPAPIHTTDRALSNEHSSCSFTLLSKRPIPALEQLARDLAAYVNDSAWSTDGLPPEQKARKELDRQAVHAELARYQDGIEWLQRDARLELAFRLANETMIRLDQKTGRAHKGWRLFQLVFIVSQLSALAWREHKPADFTKGLWSDGMDQDPTSAATVLWFPTGQGKTEAYLGLMACALFYDRCRGKTRGVTAWCRFPLRLLSLQQTQRQLDFIAAADEIRREHAKSITKSGGDIGDAFAVGFYVGEGNTPNTLSRDDTTLRSLISDPKKRHEQVVVDRCPQCGSRNIEIPPPDPTELRLKHVCTSCQFQLPIYVVDNEIYRYLPAVVVGTIDKLAMIGLSDRFGALLGDVDSECPLHGLARGGKCHERRAKGHPRGGCSPLPKPLYDPSPSLEILDELHMIDEELGAFAGHYEGILSATQQELTRLRRPDGRPIRMKVIATTATIKGEDRQCDHLLGLHSVVFPLPGPDLDRSFYWTVHRDRPLRRFVGVLPHRTTAEQAMARILQSFHAAIRWLEEKGPAAVPGLYVSSAPHFGELLELYRVSLTYVTSLVDFGKLRRTMDTQVNDFLGQRGLREVVVRELSGDTRFDDVRATLEDLQSGGRTEAVIATSMISHGVDINRLNVMVFNGMPKSMAEYIQASSRIGRAYLGVVFMIFNPVRERDRSHFRYHGKFHEYLDRMVEPVAINRWSRYAAQKTLPGLFMAHILQVGNREYWDKGRSPAHLHDLTRMKEAIRPIESGGLKTAQEPEILRVLEDAYVVQREGALELRREITEDIHTALASLRVAGAGAASITRGRPTYRGTPDYLGLRYEPMVSLRDVAEGLPFIPLTEKRKQS